MKKNYFTILLFTLFTQFSFSQSPTCENASPLCLGANGITFQNLYNVPSSPDGIDYGCLGSYPNKQWFSIRVGLSGNLNFQIAQVNLGGTPVDVDFIVWGPFTSPTCGASNLTSANMAGCSYSTAAVENFTLTNAVSDQFYTLMIANFSNVQGNINIAQTNYGQPGSATTNCDIPCPLTLGPDIMNCENSNLILWSNISDATYQWFSSTDGQLPFTTQSIVVSPSVTTTYTVVVNKPGCVANATDSVIVNVMSLNYQQPDDLVQCSSNTTATFDLTTTIPVMLPNLIPWEYYVTFHYTESDAQNASNSIANPSSFSVTNSQTIYFSIEDNSVNGGACIYVGQFDAIVLPPENPIITASTFGQVLTVSVSGNGTYQYQLDGGTPQSSNVFENVSIGNHTINVISTNGCGSVSTTFEIVMPSAPFALSPQYFNLGDTLQNLITDGQNVQWYADDAFSGIIEPEADTPLPLTTILEDNTTYYATQTINGVESENRTAVVTLLSTFSLDDFSFNNLNYFPNPVKNSLTISNDTLMESVEVSSILGQQIFSQKVNNLETEINLSTLSNGIYFVKVVCNGAEKTLKIIKE